MNDRNYRKNATHRFRVEWLDPFTKTKHFEIITAETRAQAFDIAEGKEKPLSARGAILGVTNFPLWKRGGKR